jgi:hypothetical protein
MASKPPEFPKSLYQISMVGVVRMLIPALWSKVFFWLLIESPLAPRSAKIIGLTVIFGCGCGCGLFYFHAAYRINCHKVPPLHLSSQWRLVQSLEIEPI